MKTWPRDPQTIPENSDETDENQATADEDVTSPGIS